MAMVEMASDTITVKQAKYDNLQRDSEQLRIIKAFVRSEEIICKKRYCAAY